MMEVDVGSGGVANVSGKQGVGLNAEHGGATPGKCWAGGRDGVRGGMEDRGTEGVGRQHQEEAGTWRRGNQEEEDHSVDDQTADAAARNRQRGGCR